MRRRPFMRCNRGLRKSIVSAFSDCCLARRRKAEASMWEFGPCEPRLIPLIGIGGQPHGRLSDPSPAHKLCTPGLTRGRTEVPQTARQTRLLPPGAETLPAGTPSEAQPGPAG